MSDQQDHQVQRAAQQALQEIARRHEHAVQAVWGQYPAPQPRHARAEPAPNEGSARVSLREVAP